MSRDDVMRMARVSGAGIGSSGQWLITQDELERFAAMGASAERDQCIEIAKNTASMHSSEYGDGFNQAALNIEDSIRARGSRL